MASTGRLKLKEIWGMLDECAPGYSGERKLHHWWVRYGGRTFTRLPLGEHGGKGEIERRWVKKMARFFGVLDCARRYFGWS